MRRWMLLTLSGLVCWGTWIVPEVHAQYNPMYQSDPNPQFNRYLYYPYYFYPHNYWPATGPKWPERPGEPYMRPPAYMAFPPYQERNWRYEYYMPQKYYRGQHFFLDQF